MHYFPLSATNNISNCVLLYFFILRQKKKHIQKKGCQRVATILNPTFSRFWFFDQQHFGLKVIDLNESKLTKNLFEWPVVLHSDWILPWLSPSSWRHMPTWQFSLWSQSHWLGSRARCKVSESFDVDLTSLFSTLTLKVDPCKVANCPGYWVIVGWWCHLMSLQIQHAISLFNLQKRG